MFDTSLHLMMKFECQTKTKIEKPEFMILVWFHPQ